MLTAAEAQELAELEELEALEAEEAASRTTRSPAVLPEPTSRSEAFAGGTAQGLTMGHTPQAVGAGAWLGGKLQDLIQGPVINPATGQPIERVNYTEARDATTKDLEKGAKDHAGYALAGNIAGSLALGRGAGKAVGAVGGKVAQALAPAATGAGRIAQATGIAGAQGALYNPGDEKGVVHNPLEGDFQAADRGRNAALSSLLGLGTGVLGEGIRKGVQKAGDIRLVKDASKLYDASVEKIKGATKSLNEKVIAPTDAKIRELLLGKNAKVNLKEFRELAPELVDDIELRSTPAYRREAVPGSGRMHFQEESVAVPQPPRVVPAEAGGVFPREPAYQTIKKPNPNAIAGGPEFLEERVMVPGSDKIQVSPRAAQEIPQEPLMVPGKQGSKDVAPIMQNIRDGEEVALNDILKMRKKFDSGKTWKAGGGLDEASVAAREKNAAGANKLRAVLSDSVPETDDLFAEEAKHIKLREILNKRGAKRPIEALQVKQGSTQDAILKKIDDATGSDLRDFGQRTKNAQDLLIDPVNFLKPLALPNEARKLGTRTAISLSEALNKTPEGTAGALRGALLEKRRKVK